MKAKTFLSKLIILTISLTAIFVGTNYYLDIYGLFRPLDGRSVKVYVNERTSKYLFSYRYIPENFEGIVLGPSLSANLNTKEIEQYKVYNASIMGANISELRYLVDNFISFGNLRFAIICLDPYLTKDHGKKSAMIDPKEYYGALGSTNLMKTYLFKLLREKEWLPNRFPKNNTNEYGFNNFNLEMDKGDAKEKILAKVDENAAESTYIDSLALQELKATVALLKANNIKVLAYYTPIPSQIMGINKSNYKQYQERVGSVFDENDVVLDLNESQYNAYTSDYDTFIDHGHLSEKGQHFVLEEISNMLNQHVEPKNIRYSEK